MASGIGVQNIGMAYGKDWMSLPKEGLADTLGINQAKQNIKNKLIGGAISYANDFLNPVVPPQQNQEMAPVPPKGLGSNIGQSLNQFPQQLVPDVSGAPKSDVDTDTFVDNLVPKLTSMSGGFDSFGGADALASLGDAASMFAFV